VSRYNEHYTKTMPWLVTFPSGREFTVVADSMESALDEALTDHWNSKEGRLFSMKVSHPTKLASRTFSIEAYPAFRINGR
jgi:hypothetical protein